MKESGAALVEGMRDGTLKNRSRHPYKPATIRRYELALRKHLEPQIGTSG